MLLSKTYQAKNLFSFLFKVVCCFKLAIFLFVRCVLGDQGDTIDARVLKLGEEIVKLQSQVNDQNDGPFSYHLLAKFVQIYLYTLNVAQSFCKLRVFEIIQYQSTKFDIPKVYGSIKLQECAVLSDPVLAA
jgi:hypothetical protein